MTQHLLIDWHMHCYLDEHRSAEDAVISSSRNVYRSVATPDPEQFDKAISEAGVEQFVIVALPRSEGMHVPNDFISDCVKRYPGRAVGLGSVDPREPGASEEFERCLSELGLRGLKLSPTYQAMDPCGPEFWSLYEVANAHQVPVMLHCGGAYKGSLEWADPTLIDKVALAFPELKIIIAHFGQPYMEQTAILMRKNVNVYADLSARYHRPWQLYNGLMIATEYRVTDRLLFGSDFPVLTPAQAMTRFRAINDWGAGAALPRIPDDVIESIIYERPLSMLGLRPD